MKTIDEALDIMIKDNFLDEELFNDLHNRVETFMYAAQDFSNELEEKVLTSLDE